MIQKEQEFTSCLFNGASFPKRRQVWLKMGFKVGTYC